jgi:Zn-dependent peptidase ImmA (M78 family)
MALDLHLLATKLRKYREQLEVSIAELAQATGIANDRLTTFEEAAATPTGDEILILADFFRCDYKFFISNDRTAPFEETETLYRKFGGQFSKEDRRAVQDFLFLCECEQDLFSVRGMPKPKKLLFRTERTDAQRAEIAAAKFRQQLGLDFNEVDIDVFDAIRRFGIHVFRRRLRNSTISGLFIMHPMAGKCILVNYTEDVFRQRFTAAHELGHALLDDDQDFVVSFATDQRAQREVRANAFAARFLMPPDFLRAIPEAHTWTEQKILYWAERLHVNPEPLCYALRHARLLQHHQVERFRALKIPSSSKHDPEISPSLPPKSRERIERLLWRGLSSFYVKLCFDAYYQGHISAGRLAEILLADESELKEIAGLYGFALAYAD